MTFARAACAAAVLALAPILAPAAARADDVVVFAAASLKTALDEIAADWSATGAGTAALSYAGSSALAKQIEQGAPAEVFVSADLDWMDYLAARDLIDPDTRVNLLGNQIVLVAGGADAPPVAIAPGFDLAGLLGDGRLAMADVTAVPAGRYGKAALETLGVWESVADKTAQAENVRAALAFVAQGEAPLGIVYATDARAEPQVSVVGTFADDTHPPIVYPLAVVAGATDPSARAFAAYLQGPEARAVFEAQGFDVLEGQDADAHAG
jgi:molybdate transport system substrate-binding protein